MEFFPKLFEISHYQRVFAGIIMFINIFCKCIYMLIQYISFYNFLMYLLNDFILNKRHWHTK